jgi:hypothetical protein
MSAAEYQIGGGHSVEDELKAMFNDDFDFDDTLQMFHFTEECTHWDSFVC